MHFPFARRVFAHVILVCDDAKDLCNALVWREKRLDTLVAYFLELFSSLSSDKAPHVIVPPPTFARTSRIDVRGFVE